MQRREHPPGFKPRSDQAYYFEWWYLCPECGHVQHYESAKVHLGTVKKAPVKPKNKKRRVKFKENKNEPGAYSNKFWTRQSFGPASPVRKIEPI
jgi:hypothetical protein